MTRWRDRPMRTVTALLAVALLVLPVTGQEAALPLKDGSLRFAVIGDNGTGDRPQYDVGKQMLESRRRFPFEFVLMLGDNIYGSDAPRDFERKFELPYKALLDLGVKFYASLGNHDNPERQRYYEPFNMDGKRYYSFKAPKQDVRFFALESQYLDREQLAWIERELSRSNEKWKICYFHHPIYSSGARHGSDLSLRSVLEPLFLTHGVDVVFAGHDHFYERVKPQRGITYFVSGGAGQLRRGNIQRGSPLTAKGFDADQHFMLVEIADDQMHFEAVSRVGKVVDSGVVVRREVLTNSRDSRLKH